MKKLLSVLLAITALFGCIFAFSACSGATALRYEQKYIAEDSVGKDENMQVYYIFHKDGTGEYYHHYDYVSDFNSDYNEHKHYCVSFKFTFLDEEKETIYCAYDGFKRLGGNEGTNADTSWSRLITVSKNVIMSTSGAGMTFYINENYLEEIPKFNI